VRKWLSLILLTLGFSGILRAQNQPFSDITLSSSGRPVGGAQIAVCTNPGLTTTAATVTANIAVLTMSSNPITAGFVANQAIAVSGFSGGDTYFNGGAVTSTGITNNFLILSVTSTQITYALTHANATASTNGTVFQSGSQGQACAPLAAISLDPAGLSPITQPGFNSTGLGNYQFYAAASAYYVQFYGNTIGLVIKPIGLPCAPNLACTITGAQNSSGANTFTGANTFCNSNGVLTVEPGCFSGSDIGAQVNSAYAALPSTGGVIVILAGSFSYSTPIVFSINSKPVLIQCAPSHATVLTFTPTTGTGVTWNYGKSGLPTGAGMTGCQLVGPGSGTATIGMTIGGSNGAVGLLLRDVQVNGWGQGEVYSTNVQGAEHDHVIIADNGQDISVPASLTQTGESIVYQNSFITNTTATWSATCINFGNTGSGPVYDFTFRDGSIDQCGVTIGNGANNIHFIREHFENPVNAAQSAAWVTVNGGNATFVSPTFISEETNIPGCTVIASCFIDTTNVAHIYVSGGTFVNGGGSSLAAAIHVCGTCQASLVGNLGFSGAAGTMPEWVVDSGGGMAEFQIGGGMSFYAGNGTVGAGFRANTGQTIAGVTGTLWGWLSNGIAHLGEVDTSGNMGIAGASHANGFFNPTSLFISSTAPTIAAAGCGGAAASIVVANGTAAFKINVGTTPTSACTITMPAATTGWNVTCNDITTQSTSVFVQKQTGAESTTSATITNFNDVAVATAFVASDILKCTASAD